MDRELRELERKAQQGDRHALHKLLVRKIALDDFKVEDLSSDVRLALASVLIRSIPSDSDRAAVYSEADPQFNRNHDSVLQCPGCANTNSSQFTYHELTWRSYSCVIDDAEVINNGFIEVDYQSAEDSILDAHLACQSCGASWRVPPNIDVEGI